MNTTVPEEFLPYESRRPGALEAGEVVLWEHQIPGKGWRRAPVLQLVTQRRAVVFQEDAEPRVRAVTLCEVRRVEAVTRDGRTSTLEMVGDAAVTFERLAEWREPLRLVATAAALRAGRGQPARRGGRRPADAGAVSPTAMSNDSSIPAPAPADAMEPDLLPGERPLWQGRPLSREPFDGAKVLQIAKKIGLLCIPAVMLLFSMAPGAREGGHIVVAWIAGVWLAFSLWNLLITPHVEARRRTNTRYLLTNFRAIVISRTWKRRSIHSAFLDMAEDVSIEERPDGIGIVGCGYRTIFELIPQAREVHRLLTEAIRGAGGDPDRPRKVDDLDHESQL